MKTVEQLLILLLLISKVHSHPFDQDTKDASDGNFAGEPSRGQSGLSPREEDSNSIVSEFGILHQHPSSKVEPNIHSPEQEIKLFKEEVQKNIHEYRKFHLEAHPPHTLDEITNVQHHRVKRLVGRSEKERWTKGIVPYIFENSMTPWGRNEIQIAMRRIEKYTCIRFVPRVKNVTREKYGLDHDGYLRFLHGKGCGSTRGNSRSKNGQTVSCCNKDPCTHELGHVLGLFHEQNNPDRDGWTRVNWENILNNSLIWYKKADPASVISYGYDLSSIMHYGTWGFNNGGGPTQTILFNELKIGGNKFYMFMEIVKSHNCKGLKCANFTEECDLDGYVTVVDDVCSCRCPEGLDPANRCTDVIKNDTNDLSWPGGSYAMLTTVEGCPGRGEFSEGTLTQWSAGRNVKSSDFHLKGDFFNRKTTYHFCVADNKTGSAMWPRGQYCIYRKGGICPADFQEGYIQFEDDIRSANQNNTRMGPNPDGIFDTNTRFYFCCRNDSFQNEPIDLPNDKPFVLFKYRTYHDRCQTVKGMYYTEEFYVFHNHDRNGFAKITGATPYVGVYWRGPYYYVHFCYYRPYKKDCGGILQLSRDNPSAVITSPNYPSVYDNDMECHWAVKGPKNTTILLNFNDFEIEKTGHSCKDSLEVRHSRIGQPGIIYCGDRMEKSIRSIYNMMKLRLRTGFTSQKRGFNATVSLILPENHCYDLNDFGATYRGQVNFTRDMKPCLPWRLATHCAYHTFKQSSFDSGLNANFCRNPGNGLRPWCYTKAKGCERNYCDVCLVENRYDTFDDCTELKPTGFCTKDSQAFQGCSKTCADHLPSPPSPTKVSEITCSTPQPTQDGVVVGSTTASYKVGNKVQYKCSATNETLTATCLTDGKWSIGQYVCGVCPSGWEPYQGHCYKYFEEKLKYSEAEAKCAQYGGGIIAPTKTKEDLAFVTSLRTMMRNIWLGANDKKNEGQWVWTDGTDITWVNWKKGEPNNWKNEDCAIILGEQTGNRWQDTDCGAQNHLSFVCRITVKGKKMCKDLKTNCADVVHETPDVCSNFPDFADHECHYTCGLCNNYQYKHCNITMLANVKLFENVTSIETGKHISYACADGYVLTAGDVVRACQPSGILTGHDPVCTAYENATTANNYVELTARRHVGNAKYAFTGETDNLLIDKDGQIVQWKFYSKYAGDVALQVWRPKVELANFTYEFINQTKITTKDDRIQTIDLTRTEQIVVQAGDIIGVYYGASRGGIPFDECKNKTVQVMRKKSSVSNANNFISGNVYQFDPSTNKCRTFSLTAMVGPKSP